MSQKSPKVSHVYTNQGGVECMIGERGNAIPITIDGARYSGTITGPSLFARRTDSPHKAVPLMHSTTIEAATNITNATLDIPDADAVKFAVGDKLTYYDASAGALYSGAALTLDVIGAAGSGGEGLTLLTFTGETWTTPPEGDGTDLLVVADGAQLSKNAVVVLEDIVLDGSNDVHAAGFINGSFVKSAVQNKTYFVQADNQNIQLVDIQ